MTDLFFVDSNILVYRRDLAAGPKQAQAYKWLEHLWRNRVGRLSTQVLNEFYITVTQKLTPGMPRADAQAEVRDFFVWRPASITTDTIELAFQLQRRFRLSHWDSLIASAARLSRCSHLLTEDFQDGQVLEDLTVLNPFLHDPS